MNQPFAGKIPRINATRRWQANHAGAEILPDITGPNSNQISWAQLHTQRNPPCEAVYVRGFKGIQTHNASLTISAGYGERS